MPTPTPFDIYEFCNDHAYAGTLEVRLTSTTFSPTGTPALEDLTPAKFQGAIWPSMARIWAERRTEPGGKFFLTSKSLTWKSQQTTPMTVTAVYLVGKIDGNEQLIGVWPLKTPRVMSATSPALTVFVRQLGTKLGA